MRVVPLDDAIREEKERQRRLQDSQRRREHDEMLRRQQDERKREAELRAVAARRNDAEPLIEDFLARMRRAGNPGVGGKRVHHGLWVRVWTLYESWEGLGASGLYVDTRGRFYHEHWMEVGGGGMAGSGHRWKRQLRRINPDIDPDALARHLAALLVANNVV
jgi:hypothetical protein